MRSLFDEDQEQREQRESEFVTLRHYGIKRETDAAVLLRMTPGLLGDAQWFPKSVCVLDTQMVEVSRWFVDKENLWEFES